MVILVKLSKEIKEKWIKKATDKKDAFYNRKNMDEKAFIWQIAKGWAAQEVVGNWLKENMPWEVKVYLKMGEDTYDTDHARGNCDIECKGKKCDVKVGNAVTKSFRNDDIIICVEYLLNGCFEGYKIKGYWIVKDLTEEDIHVGNNINYFIIDKKPKGISYLKKEII